MIIVLLRRVSHPSSLHLTSEKPLAGRRIHRGRGCLNLAVAGDGQRPEMFDRAGDLHGVQLDQLVEGQLQPTVTGDAQFGSGDPGIVLLEPLDEFV